MVRAPLGLLRIALGPGAPADAVLRIGAGDYILVGTDEAHDLVLSVPGTGVAQPVNASAPGPSTAFRAAPGVASRGMQTPCLKRREAEILAYLAEGWSNAEIASSLGIGVRTVRFHLEGLYGKLRVSRRGEAVSEGYRLGLLRFEA